MAAVLSTATAATTVPQPIRSSDLLLPQPTCLSHSSHSFAPSLSTNCTRPDQYSASRAAGRLARKRSDWFAYLAATVVMSSFGITSMVVMAFGYWFEWQMEGGRVPLFEMVGAFALSGDAAVGMKFLARWAPGALWHASLWYTHEVGMEFLARWAHRALWHAFLWHPHESHQRPRDGELNDAFVIIIAVPAIAPLLRLLPRGPPRFRSLLRCCKRRNLT